MSETFSSGHMLRGLQLKDLGRYPEAEKSFREALGENPNDAFALNQLAACLFHQTGRQREALQVIDQAIAIEPTEAEHFVLRSFILSGLERPKEALAAARQALELDPYLSLAFTAEAQAYLQLERWADAEMAARKALEVDADNSLSANQLAQALRLQNKLAENAAHLAGMLERDPEDAFTHANAGWAALQRGQHREAETHFREALRLDPDFDYAREGLLNSFRARSPFYRAYLKYCFWMQRLSGSARWAVVLGLYFGVKLSGALFQGRYRMIGVGIGVLYFMLVLWVWIAKGVGNFILLFDKFAKHALRRNEKIEAVMVGGGVCSGLALLCTGMVVNMTGSALIGGLLLATGGALVAAAFPFSMTFTNESRIGRVLFGTIGVVTLACALFVIASTFMSEQARNGAFALLGMAGLACIICTWIGNIPALRR